MKKAFILILIFAVFFTFSVISSAKSTNTDINTAITVSESIDIKGDRQVSIFKTYTIGNGTSLSYPDDESYKLTDGIYGKLTENHYYKSNAYVGFTKNNLNQNGDIVITIDLGSEISGLSKFGISYAVEAAAGIYAPEKIKVYVSDKLNGEYTLVSEGTTDAIKNPTEISADKKTLSLKYSIDARFVKFVITPASSFEYENEKITPSMTFIDEIEVFQTELPPKTGDDFTIFIIISGVALSCIIAIVLLFGKRKPSAL